mmetsp:Transcript_21865/g.53518  ORF Transcript_21865/g.53518 Transcript_21865/m.53518 type:complete len:119 (-) Transcript_21865:2903-3259(-)
MVFFVVVIIRIDISISSFHKTNTKTNLRLSSLPWAQSHLGIPSGELVLSQSLMSSPKWHSLMSCCGVGTVFSATVHDTTCTLLKFSADLISNIRDSISASNLRVIFLSFSKPTFVSSN